MSDNFRNDPLLGRLLKTDRQRDAIHIAIIPVVAGEKLKRGQEICIDNNGLALDGGPGGGIGVVDPFLCEVDAVKKGDRFWLLLRPGTITSLRHEWTHHDFPLPAAKQNADIVAASERWLRERAEENQISYDELVNGSMSGEGGCFGCDEGPEWFLNNSEFWFHLEIVTGKKYDEGHRESTYFRCAC